jgi:autotransporter-associated beta strand protein
MSGGTTLRAAVADLTLANAFLLNGAATVDTQGFAMTLGGVMSGAGPLTKTGLGSLTLTGNNSYAGDTTVSDGMLQIGGAGRLGQGDYAGSIGINAGATLRYSSSADQTFSGPVNGGGTLVKDTGATSTLTLTNTTTLSSVDIQAGGLENRGSLTAATAMSLSGDGASLLNAAGANVTMQGGAGTLTGGSGAQLVDNAGAINGVVNLGGGDDAYLLRATGTQTGNVDGAGGNDRLRIETAANATRTLGPGAFVNFETIDLNEDASSTGTVAVASGLALDAGPGGGALTLHRGALQLQAASSAVRAATVTIAEAATLSGIGTVYAGTGPGAGLIVNGTISPGNSIGTLNVVGNYIQNGAYNLEFRAPTPGVAPVAGTDNDLIRVSGVATINDGAVLRLFPLSTTAAYDAALTAGNNPTPGKLRYTIIQTTGGMSAGKVSLLGFSGATTETVGNDLQLVLSSANGGRGGGGGGLLVNRAPAGLALVLSQDPQFGCRGSLLGRNTIGFHELRSDEGCLWADGYAQLGGVKRVNGDGAEPWSVAGAKYTTAGVAFGGDRALNRTTFAGGSFTYGNTSAQISDAIGSQSLQGFHGALYGAFDDGVWNAGFSAGYSHYAVDATRNTLLATSPTARARYDMRQYRLGGVLRRTLALDENWWVLPEARLNWEPLTRNAFTEAWGGDANFNSEAIQWNIAKAGAGVILRHRLAYLPAWTAEVELGWQRLLGNTAMPLRGYYQGAPTTLYQTSANAYLRDSASVRGALTNRVSENLSVILNYAGQFNAQRYDNLFNLMVRRVF